MDETLDLGMKPLWRISYITTGSVNAGQKRSCEEQVNVDAPLFHVVPYVTGGYQRLLRMIKTDCVPDLPEYGYHTNSEGHFDPKGECVIGLRYKVKKILDTKGQSAVLVLAQDEFSHKPVVIKVLHSHFYQLGGQESHVLRKLAVADPLNLSHTLRLLTTVAFDSHYCLVFDPLIPEPLTTVFSNIPARRILPDLRRVGLRLLASVGFLQQQNFIHTDLKPDNILLRHENDLDSVHIVDFGNTIHYVHSEVSLYYKDFELQTPLYRAPEVMFGVPFGPEIDIWSLGCVLAELFLGKPLFLGTTKEEIMEQMTSLLGPFPTKIFRRGKYYRTYRKFTSEETQTSCTLKLLEHLQCKDIDFADLIAQMLKYNPEERLTVSEAARHPFFASYLPLSFLLPKSSDCFSYPALSLSKAVYSHSPYIPSDIRRQPLSSLDLLRQGTAELPKLVDETIVKPSPRMGTYAVTNQTKNDTQSPTKRANEQSNRNMPSDISVVRNFIVCKDQQSYSKNVKDRMSALLEVIREEQDCVEDDLERRNASRTSDLASKKAFDGVLLPELECREAELPRPCPRYGRLHVKGEAASQEKQRTVFKSNECRSNVGERDVGNTATGKQLPMKHSSSSTHTFQQEHVGKTKSGRRPMSSRNVDTSSLYKIEDMEVKDGCPTSYGTKERKGIQQSRGYVKNSSCAGEKVVPQEPPDSRNLSFCSTTSGAHAAYRDLSYISGNKHDNSGHSDYSTDYDSESSWVEIRYSHIPESDKGSCASSGSAKVKEMNKLKEQIGMKRSKSGNQAEKERHLMHYHNKKPESSNFNAHTEIEQTLLSHKHSSKKAVLHSNSDIRSPGVRKDSIVRSQVSPSSCNKTDFTNGAKFPVSINRKRLASDRISDDEYVELLSPLAAKSKKKKAKPEKSGRYTIERSKTYNSQSSYRKHASSLVKYTETDLHQHGKATGTETDKHRSKNLGNIPRQKHNKQSILTNFLEVKAELKQLPSRKIDLIPSTYWAEINRADNRRSFTENESPPSVSPINKAKRPFLAAKWVLDSPEIVYKGSIMENIEYGKKVKQTCNRLPRIEDEKDIAETKSDKFLNRSLSKFNSLSAEKERATSHKLLKRISPGNNTSLEYDEIKPVTSNSFDQANRELSDKEHDYLFRGTPDTDLKQLASRGGYAERIARIGRKRKKARKSLAFDPRQGAAEGYREEHDDGNVADCIDVSSDNRDVNFESVQDTSNEYRLLYTSTVNTDLKMERRNKVFSEENLVSEENNGTHSRVKYSSKDWVKVPSRNRRKPVLCREVMPREKFQQAFKQKKFDSTFTIDFESPLREKK